MINLIKIGNIFRCIGDCLKIENGFKSIQLVDSASNYKAPVHVEVNVLIPIFKISDQYISYNKKDWRIIFNYIKNFGVLTVIQKFTSRLKERGRNKKYLSVGLGQVFNIGDDTIHVHGKNWVVFLACNHPRYIEYLVLEEGFVIPWPYDLAIEKSHQINIYEKLNFSIPYSLLKYQGWSPYSGIEVDCTELRTSLIKVADRIRDFLCSDVQPTQRRDKHKFFPQERIVYSDPIDRRGLSGVLFGLGNYAKTALIPNLDARIRIDCIHEVDPAQLGSPGRWKHLTLDTAGFPRPDERYDVYFIAGYHHTHAPIAIHALRQGAHAVVEKPIVTTRSQLNALRNTLKDSSAKFFCGFHKRYSVFNELAWQHLGASPGDPVDYHCIVFEIPLPQRHWYRWPNSGSRIVSNGCHWIDHFLYFNGYQPVLEHTVREAMNGDITIFMELANGATFSMVLTERGSKRLGVRDYIELRYGNTTISMTDGSRYVAENTHRVLKRARANRIDSYRRMYRMISSRLADNGMGDNLDTLYSSEVMLMLEEALQTKRNSEVSRTIKQYPRPAYEEALSARSDYHLPTSG